MVDCGDVAFDTNRTETVVPAVERAGITALAAATLAHDLLCMW